VVKLVQKRVHKPVYQWAGNGEILHFQHGFAVFTCKHGVKTALAAVPQAKLGTQAKVAGRAGVKLKLRGLKWGKERFDALGFVIQLRLIGVWLGVLLKNGVVHNRAKNKMDGHYTLYGFLCARVNSANGKCPLISKVYAFVGRFFTCPNAF
jgi:hypothetical protein